MISSTEAIVLNKKNFGDTSLICNLYSKDYGKIAIIAKGAKSLKNPLGAILQPMNYIDCVYYYKSKRSIQIIKEASIITKFFDIEKHYLKMNCGLTMIDVIQNIHYDENPSKIIFRLLKKMLFNLNNYDKKNVFLLYVFFQLQCLIYLGYCPAIDKCSQCYQLLHSASFDSHSGQLSCSKCNSNSEENLNKKLLTMINYLMNTHIDQIIINLKYEYQDLMKINNFLYKYILFHVPDIKKSKAFFTLKHEK